MADASCMVRAAALSLLLAACKGERSTSVAASAEPASVPPSGRVDPDRQQKKVPTMVGSAATAPASDDCCMGKNPCRGKGGCAVPESHACAGQNACRGRGGCRAHCPR